MIKTESIQKLFAGSSVIDVHVNVGRRIKRGHEVQFIDGNLDSGHVVRQFDPSVLAEESTLSLMGLRSHYGPVEIPQEYKERFIPSVAINWLGVNPERVEQELQKLEHSRPIIWFQSFADPYHRSVIDEEYKQSIAAKGKESIIVTHTDQFGRLTQETLQVLEVARDQKAIIAAPHSNWERTLPLIEQAVEMGLSVLWTHPDSRLIKTPVGIQQAMAWRGVGQVFIERAAVFLRDGKPGAYSPEQIVNDISAVGMEYIIFSSDLGRFNASDPLLPEEGLEWYAQQLIKAGLTLEDLEMGLVVNPQRLLQL